VVRQNAQCYDVHFGDFNTTENLHPEDQSIHASIVEKLKPILENETSLIINDLDSNTLETTGNKPATHGFALSATHIPPKK